MRGERPRPAMHITRPALAGMIASCLLAGCDAPQPAAPVAPPTQVVAVDTPPPDYPLEVACQGLGGKVELFVTIGTEGTVTRAETRQSSGQPALDAAALEAVRDWRFRPATYNGQPVEAGIHVPITFNVPPEEPADCYFLPAEPAPPPAGA